jgi:kynurenine formamidase
MFKNCKFIDLTHTLDEHIPVWPNTKRLERAITTDYAQKGYRVEQYAMAAGTGTHMDAPGHFVQGGRSISDFNLNELIVSACVLNITKQAQENPDYAITPDDLLNWEKQYGTIPAGSLFLACTGWSQYWPDEQRYLNRDQQGNLHFPGFSKAAAELLVERNVVGIGIDSISLDPGLDKTFGTHYTMLPHDKYQLENLTNLEQLPATGATVFVMPLKIKNAPEAAARVVAVY